VRDAETGFLVPHGDTRAMATAMLQLAHDPPLISVLGVRAREFAQTFTWERAADETERHLNVVRASHA
jgi:glycosyltransferase involved in cell wall biosynthesis